MLNDFDNNIYVASQRAVYTLAPLSLDKQVSVRISLTPFHIFLYVLIWLLICYYFQNKEYSAISSNKGRSSTECTLLHYVVLVTKLNLFYFNSSLFNFI